MAAKTASLSVNIIADAAKAKAGLKEAETAFGKFRSSVDGATGTMGKFKAGSGAALDYVKSNAMNFAAAAGAAIVAFGVKSVMAFQDLAISIGKFSDATGLSAQEASRLVEVAGDIGIEIGALEKSLGFMNKTLGNNAQAFKDLGVEIAYSSGGAVDANKTFLNVVDRLNQIEDPAKRAAAGAKLLGRGWQEMAELIAMGSGDLSKSLQEVSEQKVIDPQEVENARQFRASMDGLKDSFEDFSLAIGKNLLPVVTQAIEDLTALFKIIDQIPGAQDAMNNKAVESANIFQKASFFSASLIENLLGLNEETAETTVVTDEMKTAWQEGYRAMIDARTSSDDLAAALQDKLVAAADQAKNAIDRLKGTLNLELAMLDAKEEIEGFRVKWEEALKNGKVNADEFNRDVLGIQLMLLQLRQDLGVTATAFLNNEFRVLVDTRQLDRAWQLLQAIKSGGELKIPSGPGTGDTALMSKIPVRAAGGIITKAEVSMVGEAGAEAIIPLTNPTRAMELMQASGLDMLAMSRNGGGGTTVINVNVDAGLVSSPDQVGQQIIEAIRRAERRSGQVFVAA